MTLDGLCLETPVSRYPINAYRLHTAPFPPLMRRAVMCTPHAPHSMSVFFLSLSQQFGPLRCVAVYEFAFHNELEYSTP